MSRKGYATINSKDEVLEEFEWDNVDDCPFEEDWECCLTGDMIPDGLNSICEYCPCAYEVEE